jgi:hypothetical protein
MLQSSSSSSSEQDLGGTAVQKEEVINPQDENVNKVIEPELKPEIIASGESQDLYSDSLFSFDFLNDEKPPKDTKQPLHPVTESTTSTQSTNIPSSNLSEQ